MRLLTIWALTKNLSKKFLFFTFKEIAITLLLKGKTVMIRSFVKFVVAAAAIKNIEKSKQRKQK